MCGLEKTRRIITFLSFYVLLPVSIFAQQPVKFSLEEAKDYAIEHNYTLKNSKADAAIAGKQVWEITASGLPQINGTAGYQYFVDLPTNLIPAEFFGGEPGEFAEVQFGTKQNFAATLSVSQLIFDGSYIVGLQAARIYRELALRTYQKSEIEIRHTVAQTYYLSLVAIENLKIVRGNLENMEKTLFETQKMFEAGFTDAINVDQLRLNVVNMKNSIANMERLEALTLNMLKFQIGLDVDQPLELTDNLESLFNNISLEPFSVLDFNPETHIDFRIMQSQERMQLMTMRREWSFYLPNISASYVRQESAYRNEFNFFESGKSWFPTSIIGLNVNIPIFSSGLRASRVQQARLNLEKAQNNTMQVAQSLLLQKQEALSEIQTALEKYNNEKENLELAQKIDSRTRIMFREGMASSLELTQANNQMLTTQANFINAMFELLNAKNKLEKALGRI